MKRIDDFLDTTDIQIKNDLDEFIDGLYNGVLSKEEISAAIEYSFLLNHLYLDDRGIIFKYDKLTIKVDRGSIIEYSIIGNSTKESIISLIKGSDDFKSCFKSFLRDKKIEKIIQ